MTEYPKIQSLYKRNQTPPNKGKFMIGEYSLPEFKALKDIKWIGTEKVDGTNIRIILDNLDPENPKVLIRGKTDNAQINVVLYEYLTKTFTVETFRKGLIGEKTPELPLIAVLYGEGYGSTISNPSGKLYRPDGSVDFILFDIRIEEYWLTRDATETIAEKMNIPIVPIVFEGPLNEAEAIVKRGLISRVSHTKDHRAEGMVLVPEVQLFNRKDERIITKIKTKDY